MKLVYSLRESSLTKKTLYTANIVFCFTYVFCVPSFGESSSFLRYSIYLSMVMLGLSSLIYCFLYKDLKINKFVFLIPLFVIHAFVGTAIYSKEYRSWISLVLLALSFFIFIFSFKAIGNKNLSIAIISGGFFAFSLFFIFYYRNELIHFKSYGNESFRLGSAFDNENGVAAYAIVGFASALYLVLFSKKKYRFFFILPSLTSTLVGIATGSRTFLLMLPLFLLVFSYFAFRKHKWIFLIIVLSIIVVGIVVMFLPFMSTLRERFLRALGTVFGIGNKIDRSTIERTVWTDYGFYLGFERLIFGYGVNGFGIVSGINTYSHSNYAETICNFGLIGLIIFYLPLVILFVKTVASKRIDKNFVVSFFIYYAVVSFTNVFYYKKIYYLVLAFMFYLVYIDEASLIKKPIVNNLKRLIFVCDTMNAGGAERVISTLSNEMAKRDIIVTIIGVGDRKEPKSFYGLKGCVRYINFCNKGKRINSFKRVFLLRKTIKNIYPDVVISFLPNANIYTWVALIGTNIPHIVSERNNPYLDPKGFIRRFLKTCSFEAANGAVFQTQDAMSYYSNSINEKGSIIKNPIFINPNCEKESSARCKVVLAVGRLTKQKNYKCLIDAFKIFNRKKNNEYILKIYGNGPLESQLKDYCASLNISKHVVFAGNDQNWQSKEKNDAMFVLSSDYEGMPNSLAEAMALGIPSISTDCPTGGSRELIQHGVNGFLVRVNDPKDLVDKMLMINDKNSNMFSTNNSNMVNEYSSDNITTLWINYIMSLTRATNE